MDGRLAGGGLGDRRCTRLPPLRPAPGDDAAATLFLAAAAARFARAAGEQGQVLWALSRRDLFAPGLAQAGLTPDRLIYAECRNDEEVLAVMEEGVRHGSLAAVIGEVGRAEMAATRRLQLAAEEGGTAGLAAPPLARSRRPIRWPRPLRAITRWRIGCAPSSPLPCIAAKGIGRARWRVALVRQRGGPPHRMAIGGPRCRGSPRSSCPIWRSTGSGGRSAATAAGRRTPQPPDSDRVLPARGDGWRPGARWAREKQPSDVVLRSDGAGALVTAHSVGNRRTSSPRSGRRRARSASRRACRSPRRGSLVPGLDVRAADPEGDAAWLARLGLFAARRWTPRAAVSGPDGLWLDLTGVAHLFGGERRMCERILAFCSRLGFSARIAVAGTTGAAHALARFGGEPLILCPSGRRGRGDRADAARRACASTRTCSSAAHRLGLERIGELIAMPRAPLQRRFGSDLLLRLDQALGRAAEPFDPIVPEDAARRSCSASWSRSPPPRRSPKRRGEAVRRLVPLLAEAGLGVRRLVLACERVDNERAVSRSLASPAPPATAPICARLLWAKIETDRARLRHRAPPPRRRPGRAARARSRSRARWPARSPRPTSPPWSTASPSASARRRIHRLSALESDLPERSVARAGPLAERRRTGPPGPARSACSRPPEPVDQVMSALPDGAAAPLQLARHGLSGRRRRRPRARLWRMVAAATDERAAVRDYFQVEDEDGARFWLFRKGDGEDPATGDLSWHLHGLFA